jgi:3-dehydroquinate dehydratase II
MPRDRVTVLHGVNLGALDLRPAAHYGDLTFRQLEDRIQDFADELDLRVTFAQTDEEAEYVAELHRARDDADGLLLNPGAWTHYAWSIRDALEIAGKPAVEVHLSDVDAREEFRRVSVIRDLCVATVKGQGVDGYKVALTRLKEELA